MQIPEMRILNAYYGKLSNYLHNLKKPSDSIQNQEWWNTLIQLLEEIKTYMFEFFRVPRAFFQMNEIGLKLYEEFKDINIAREEIARKILEGYK